MIKATELRIGNMIESNHFESRQWHPIRVTGTQMSPFGTEQISWKAMGCCALGMEPIDEGYRPVKLTCEILEKCGFNYAANVTAYGVFSRQPYLFSVCVTEKGFELFGGQWPIGKTFQYLHQLQNLFFALTGEELEVKL